MAFSRIFSKSNDPYLRDHEIEGTPFVPMAVMVSEIIERLPPGVEGLSNFMVEAPIMLRKGRTRETMMRLSDGPLAFLDAGGSILASGIPMISGSVEERRFTKKFSFAFEDQTKTGGESKTEGFSRDNDSHAEELFLPRESLYPDLFFHGPTLQADFSIIDVDDGAMSINLSGLSDPVTDSLWKPWSSTLGLRRTNPIVLDLALQCAALEAMVTCGTFMLPRGFNGIFFVDETFPHVRACRVLLCQDGKGGYDCVVTGHGEKSFLVIEGLHFTCLGREMTPVAMRVLDHIREYFDLDDLETVH